MDKPNALKDLLKSYEKVAVAFSGGVDSTFLLKTAISVLGNDNVLAIFADTPFHSEKEKNDAISILKGENANHLILEADLLKEEKVYSNPKDRCYYCKHLLFSKMKEAALQKGFNVLLDGTQKDDEKTYRPGLKALKELDIKSPLALADFSKVDVRNGAREVSLAVSDKPSSPCLASRVPYGSEITKEKLLAIEAGEKLLSSLGISELRLRHMGDTAKIEVNPSDFEKIVGNKSLTNDLKKLGFTYITLDLQGFRSGSMDEAAGIK